MAKGFKYSLSIETARTPLAGGNVQLDAWVSSSMGFEDPGVFLLHRRRTLVNKDATPLFETFANPCTLVEYPYRFVERNYGMYRDRAVSLVFGSSWEADVFESKMEERRGRLVETMNGMSADIGSSLAETLNGVEIRASGESRPYMMIQAVAPDGSDPFVFQADAGGFSRFVGVYGVTAEQGVRKNRLEVIAYSTRAPLFLDLIRTDLTRRCDIS